MTISFVWTSIFLISIISCARTIGQAYFWLFAFLSALEINGITSIALFIGSFEVNVTDIVLAVLFLCSLTLFLRVELAEAYTDSESLLNPSAEVFESDETATVSANPEGLEPVILQLAGKGRLTLIDRTKDVIQLPAIYMAADTLFNPTTEENNPTVNLEAEACGLHVVTNVTGGCREKVQLEDSAVVDGYAPAVSQIITAFRAKLPAQEGL